MKTNQNIYNHFEKCMSCVENYKTINDDTFLLCEYFDGKRFFSNYKFSIREDDEKFEMWGVPRKRIYVCKSNKLNLIYII